MVCRTKEADIEDLSNIANTYKSYLGLSTRPVGVRLIREGEPADDSGFDKPQKRMTFCRFVREAAQGKNYLMRLENLDCPNAEVTLGFREPKYVNIEPRIREKTSALSIGPLEDADVVMLLLNPEQVMTMSILLEGVNAKFKGDMAVCGEAMAHVFNTGSPNVTFLCTGARTFGGYEGNELVMALPLKVFLQLPAKMTKFASLSKKAKDGLAQLLLRIK